MALSLSQIVIGKLMSKVVLESFVGFNEESHLINFMTVPNPLKEFFSNIDIDFINLFMTPVGITVFRTVSFLDLLGFYSCHSRP